MEIYPQVIDGVTLRVENKQIKLCDVYVGRLSGGLAHHCPEWNTTDGSVVLQRGALQIHISIHCNL